MNTTLFIIFTLLMSFTHIACAEPVENDFGIVNAWYNGQEAMVENINLKIGEPAEITVSIISKIDCNVYLELTNPLVTKPYEIISGPSEFNELIQNRGIKSGWSKNYTWIIKPNDKWVNGNAPINIFVEFSDRGDDRHEEFTIVNPYILNEQYSGPAPTTTDPSSTDQPPSQGSPGFGVVGALMGIMLVVGYWSGKS
ncbi:MAG: sarcinarray family MAST domain-containing protein [ANME-2 cluster archaeon]|nr:sarcinarray family MAST domain-containing protein [ANME-2 cluster archaeon]